jgi:hypothetical protein
VLPIDALASSGLMIASYVAPLAASNTISTKSPSRIHPTHRSQPFLRRGACVGRTALGEEVTVSLGPLLGRVVQPSQMRLASLRLSIKNASMADLAQSEVKTDV